MCCVRELDRLLAVHAFKALRCLKDGAGPRKVTRSPSGGLPRPAPGEIEDDRGWLAVVTSRLCLDQIRSARVRRERPHDAGEIEFVAADQPPVGLRASADPAGRVTLDDASGWPRW